MLNKINQSLKNSQSESTRLKEKEIDNLLTVTNSDEVSDLFEEVIIWVLNHPRFYSKVIFDFFDKNAIFSAFPEVEKFFL